MAIDNSAQGGTDTIRDLARQAGLVKTQVMQLDLGGASANSEVLITAGQQIMAASVPVVFASNQTALATTQPTANNSWGQATAITAGASAVLVSLTSSANYQISGFIAHGTGDGYFTLKINSFVVLSGRIRSTLPVLMITLPNSIKTTTGSTVTLNVTNESGSTADYEITLLGA